MEIVRLVRGVVETLVGAVCVDGADDVADGPDVAVSDVLPVEWPSVPEAGMLLEPCIDLAGPDALAEIRLESAALGPVESLACGVTDAGPIVCGVAALFVHAAASTKAAAITATTDARTRRPGRGARRIAVSLVLRIVTPENLLVSGTTLSEPRTLCDDLSTSHR